MIRITSPEKTAQPDLTAIHGPPRICEPGLERRQGESVAAMYPAFAVKMPWT